MSRIDELIAHLAPQGVRHALLSDVADYSPTRVDAVELDETNFVGVDNLLANKGGRVDASYPPNTARLTAYEPGDVLLGNIRPYLKKVWLATNAGGCSGDVLTIRIAPAHRDRLSSEFLYYVLSSDRFFAYSMQHARGAKMPRGSKAAILNYRIPMPPLEVQREVVRILDQFTQLEAELEAELEARRQQYAFYRDQLLAFSQAGEVRTVAMRDVGSFFGGLSGKSKGDFTDGNARFVSYINVFNNIAVDLARDDFVRVDPGERQHALTRGDIIFTGSSETPDEVGMSSVVTDDLAEPTYLNSFSIGFRLDDPDLLDPEFAKHLFRSTGMRQQIIKTASGVTRFNVSKARLGKVEFPVPPKDEQARIAGVLDDFEALVNSLSEGLPAELAARRQQYEHYRDVLLTFEETAA